ncbi:MAG: hypothetical protein C0625_14130 [Arcobacter sp.]|nr:MAG: hypothetical protein C0625_14130 [Arcobacter sp.]
MPHIHIKITEEGVTAKEKAQLIEGATKLLEDVLNKNRNTTFVTIEEVPTDNWGIGGEQVTKLRKKAKKEAKKKSK